MAWGSADITDFGIGGNNKWIGLNRTSCSGLSYPLSAKIIDEVPLRNEGERNSMQIIRKCKVNKIMTCKKHYTRIRDKEDTVLERSGC